MAGNAKRAWTQMFAQHGPVLRGFFVRRGANEDAEDMVQETYLRLLRAHQQQGEAIANPEAYLYTVALNLAREQAARRKQAPLRIEEMEQFSQLLAAADNVEDTAQRQQRLRGWGMGLAAALCGVAVLAGWAWPRTASYSTAHGEQRSVQLADGSTVHLNAQSALRATMTPWSRRLQLLRGQASVVVAPDRRPLQVLAGALRVEDIGTTFDIALYRQQARIDAASGKLELASEDVAAMHAWWQRRIVFRDEPLANVAEDFNRLNRTRLLIDDAAADAMRLTGNLRGNDVASLRAFLAEQPTLRVSAGADVIRVGSRAASPPGAH